jgi:pyrroline-5-carboxylate reductase
MQLAVIGPGTMGLMAARRLVECGVFGAGDVRLSRVGPDRRPHIESTLPGATLPYDNAAAVAGADLVIVAVKPKQFADVAAGLNGAIGPDALVVSVMTAINLTTMSDGLGVPNVARASTNIGIQAGVATTFWIVGPGTSKSARELAIRVFAAWGDEIECSDEPLLDVAMVGVGSGPALVIEFAQAMIQAMENHGMTRAQAEQGIMSLLRGTAELVRGGDRSPAEFQRSVVAPGGITAEALQSMEDGKFQEIVIEAFRRAHEKTSRLTNPK